ncbi:hypothetical protein WA171_005757 [Blastocystis sp. BT1]
MGKTTYVLFESASGYSLYEVVEKEEIAGLATQVQQSITDFSKFSKIVKLKAFCPFESAESALENCNDISEGVLSNTLKVFLEVNLPSVKKLKDSSFVLGVVDD